MGLDMYLTKKTYVKKWDHIPAGGQEWLFYSIQPNAK